MNEVQRKLCRSTMPRSLRQSAGKATGQASRQPKMKATETANKDANPETESMLNQSLHFGPPRYLHTNIDPEESQANVELARQRSSPGCEKTPAKDPTGSRFPRSPEVAQESTRIGEKTQKENQRNNINTHP